ncbi:hypothetical protein [Conexibacter arvalis]|uniref:Uncharacterized protein n=1 Tax=Conexibacter arvalis TaxID=912552 RepID=A0A840IBC7_9ACTN|nr:hypothetical protein [Conexibacter arvalis]MBB4662199.1 hypothetical protein [Conexibacter arvalis]
MRLELETPWNGVAVWLNADEEEAWRPGLQDVIRIDASDANADGHPVRAVIYVALGHATWIVPSLLGILTMMGMDRLGLSLLIAIPLGFMLIGALILGPPVTATRRAVGRWMS